MRHDEPKNHPLVPTLERIVAAGETSRRAFLRRATLWGVSATAAYVFVGAVTDAEASISTRDTTDAAGRDTVNAEIEIASAPNGGGGGSPRDRKGWRGSRSRRRGSSGEEPAAIEEQPLDGDAVVL